jgi:hypothetical protein
MQSSREHARYQCWNLELTGEILCRRFIHSSIVIIRPNDMKDGTYARLVVEHYSRFEYMMCL